jgi:hypothetical protein
MNAPDYLRLLRQQTRSETLIDGTAQTAKSPLHSLCSSPLAHSERNSHIAPAVGADTQFDQEWFEERAAIYEFDAGFTREESERRAYLEVTTWRH